MPRYEQVTDGEVTERVSVTDGSFEDTRLGLAVLEGTGGWRLAEDEGQE
jgi:hypothetical protein